MRVQLLPFPALLGTHYSWVGWSNVRKFFAQGNQALVLPHIPQLYRLVNWSNVGKVLAQGNNNNKQHYLGIEPGSSGSQADPKPLHAAAPACFCADNVFVLIIHTLWSSLVYCYNRSTQQTIQLHITFDVDCSIGVYSDLLLRASISY